MSICKRCGGIKIIPVVVGGVQVGVSDCPQCVCSANVADERDEMRQPRPRNNRIVDHRVVIDVRKVPPGITRRDLEAKAFAQWTKEYQNSLLGRPSGPTLVGFVIKTPLFWKAIQCADKLLYCTFVWAFVSLRLHNSNRFPWCEDCALKVAQPVLGE